MMDEGLGAWGGQLKKEVSVTGYLTKFSSSQKVRLIFVSLKFVPWVWFVDLVAY